MIESKTMKLKTLKDIDRGSNKVWKYELKQEAIKWIKFHLSKKRFAKAHSLMEFHNITEEDLK